MKYLCIIHGSQTSDYFTMMPPTLEEWTSQGRQAHSIPANNIFNGNFNPDDDDEIEYDGDSDYSSDDD